MVTLESIDLENGYKLEISHDDYAESPRHDDNLGTFWTWHRRYSSPDKHSIPDPMYKLPADTIGIKVWMYDHSGCSYAAADANPFHCPWDSGQVGWIFATREDIRKWFGVKRITKTIIQMTLDLLEHEVEIYSQWVNGEVYRWTVLDAEGEEIDSCGGYYGSTREEIIEEAKQCLNISH